jgi:hypothetical protein
VTERYWHLPSISRSGGREVLTLDRSGVFSDATAQLPAILDNTQAVALGDLDLDGDLDILLGNFEQEDSLISNLAHDLAWRGIPRVGKPLTLDLFGPVWGAWFLAFSLESVGLSLPPFGTLRLDPTGIHQVFASLLDGTGKSSITFDVPADSSLTGRTVYWQAIVASPAKFTNLEITKLSDL